MDKLRIALIPAYEPDEKLVEIAGELKRLAFEIVIVDDGSDGAFADIFTRCAEYASIIRHAKNMGKGAAIKTALEYIRGRYEAPYTVVTLDADGQHKVRDVLRVCESAGVNSGALILGVRKFDGNVPFRSKIGNYITQKVFGLVSGSGISDTQTGLRAFSDRILPRLLNIPGRRYEYEMNMLLQLAKDTVTVKEIQIETVYINENASSHFKPFGDSLRIYREIIRFSASSLISFALDFALYCVLTAVLGNLTAANIISRVASAAFNYTANRKIVFKSDAPVIKSGLQYALLAACILFCNTVLLNVIAEAGINKYPAKIVVEIIMFADGWYVQRNVIFKKKGERRQDYENI